MKHKCQWSERCREEAAWVFDAFTSPKFLCSKHAEVEERHRRAMPK